MTLLEFWGCTLITFGPALAMFTQTVAHEPIKIIVLISSAFFWLLSFLLVAISWAIIRQFCDYLLVGAILAVMSQEFFRFLFHMVTKRAQIFLNKLIIADNNRTNNHSNNNTNLNDNDQREDDSGSVKPPSNRSTRGPNERIQMDSNLSHGMNRDILPLSYVSGLGFGIINAAFSMMNVLSDYIGPGTVGLKGDSMHFLLVSSLLALAFLLLNVFWSVMMAASIEKHDRRLGFAVIITHLVATIVTFFNKWNYQLISLIVVYSMTALCSILALKAADIDPRSLLKSSASRSIH